MGFKSLDRRKERNEFDFITDEIGQFKVDRVKITKKGIIFLSGTLAYWVDFIKVNEALLLPSNWGCLTIIGTLKGSEIALDEDVNPENYVVYYSPSMSCFDIMKVV
ncbi:MAG: hypothetical protein WA919_26390 [Coleofasciculaceae cyanobacterium]